MPQGRRKTAAVEFIPPPEKKRLGRPPKKLVEAEHTIKYSAPVPVEIEEEEIQPVDEEEEELLFIEEEATARRKKTAKDEREDLRRELDKYGTISSSRLKLSIDKYRFSDGEDSGISAEKDYCAKYAVTKEHILSDDYLDVARKWGSGRYWFTLRMDNKIVRMWERQITAAIAPGGSMNPADPISPYPIGAEAIGQAPSMKEYIRAQREALKETFEMAKLFREAYGHVDGQQPVADPKVAALQLLTENPDVMEKVGAGIAKIALGSNGMSESNPWAEVALEAIKTGQAAEIFATIIREIMTPFRNLGAQNVTPQISQPQINMRPSPNFMMNNPTNAESVTSQNFQSPIPDQAAPAVNTSPQATPQVDITVSPADALIVQLIEAMERQAPLNEAQSLINIAIYRNPELGESIDELLNLSVDQLLDLLSAYAPKIKENQNAKPWLEALTGSLISNDE